MPFVIESGLNKFFTQVFLDIVESVNLLMSSKGEVSSCCENVDVPNDCFFPSCFPAIVCIGMLNGALFVK